MFTLRLSVPDSSPFGPAPRATGLRPFIFHRELDSPIGQFLLFQTRVIGISSDTLSLYPRHSPPPFAATGEELKMETFRIRKASTDDIPQLLEMIRALAAYEKLESECIVTEEKLRSTLFNENSTAQVILMEIGEGGAWKNAGFALYFTSYSTFLGTPGIYVEDLFIKPEYRGRGLGRRLLVHIARLAIEKGCGRMEWAVLNWNEPAWKFYSSLGAKSQDDWTIHRLSGNSLRRLADEES
jgi:GNAT superfamily N-acetyltransferase